MGLPMTKSALQTLQGNAFFRLRENRVIVIAVNNKKGRNLFPFDITQSSMVKHIVGHKNIESQDLTFLVYMMYLFTLRLVFNRRIKKFSKLDKSIVDDSRDKLFNSFDLVRYKIATMKCIVRKYNPNKHLKEINDVFESCDLSREDGVLYCLAYYNGDIERFKELMDTVEDKFVLSCEALHRETEDPKFYKEIRNAASYWASKKLSFVANGNRYTIEDFRHDLMMRSIQAYYWVRPFYNSLHATNYAKRAIQGQTFCLIDYYTDETRARTRSLGDNGYENTIVQLTEENDALDGYLEDHLIHMIDTKKRLASLGKEQVAAYLEATL